MVCAGTAIASAQGTTSLTPGGSHTVWAYGAIRSINFHGASADGWVYQGTATYGYAVVLNQTNLTSTTFELAANRTMGVSLSVEYCLLACAGSKEVARINYHAWEIDDEWANFTTAGTVYENGAPVAAIALDNSHSTVQGALMDVATGPQRLALLAINVSSAAEVEFATPLGILPETLAAGAQWNDSSMFTAAGSYDLVLHYVHSGPVIPPGSIGPETFSGNLSGSGNVSVLGSDEPAGVSFSGVPYQNLTISVTGPFSVREGFILVPSEVDLFGGSATGTGNATGASSVEMTSIYARPFVGGHLGIGGSEWLFVSNALNPTVATALSTSSPGVSQIASGSDSLGSTSVQGVPMAVPASQGVQKCLVSGVGCPSSSPRSYLGLIVVGGVALTAVLVAMVVIVERRRLPPPPRTNAGLYPPVVTMPGSYPPATGPNPPPPPPPEEDPLSHLW